jgi:hypothetical protein
MTQQDPLHTFVSKLGTARQVSKSRIWIEGKRLVDAGFTVGAYFVKEWLYEEGEPSAIALRLTKVGDGDVMTTAPCKVSGKDSKPIIDITGASVRDVFGSRFDHVTCVFELGRITITGAA